MGERSINAVKRGKEELGLVAGAVTRKEGTLA